MLCVVFLSFRVYATLSFLHSYPILSCINLVVSYVYTVPSSVNSILLCLYPVFNYII